MATTVVPVETPQGPGRLFLDLAEQPSTILVLGHGAGGGVGAADLELLAAALPQLGTAWCGSSSRGVLRGARWAHHRRGWTRPGLQPWSGSRGRSGAAIHLLS